MSRQLSIAGSLFAAAVFASPVVAQTVDVAKEEHVTMEIEGERPEPPKSADLQTTTESIVEISNAFRKQEGRSELTVDRTLRQTAQEFADYMAENDRYGHQADGRTPSERAKAHGYDFAIVLENIAYAYDSRGFEAPALAEKFVQGWIESPPHRENLLDPDVTQIGVGVAESSKTHYYYAVQMFGRPESLAVQFTLFNATQTPVTYELGERPFILEPRYVRTHRSGRPPELTIRWPEESQQQPTTLDPESGTRFRIETTESGKFGVTATKPSADGPPVDAEPPSSPAAVD